MNTSEKIEEIAAALSKAQGAMTGAKKDSKNPFFKSTYSDLASVMSAISGPFLDNGLSFIQSPEFSENKIVVITRIMHSSGQWIEGSCALPPTKNDAQGYGSAITYAKRYGLQAMAGVPSVDDDGNEAVKHADKKPRKKVDHTLELMNCKTLNALRSAWAAIPAEAKLGLEDIKNNIKLELEASSAG